MISGIILIIQVGLAALVVLMGYRMTTLVRNEPMIIKPVSSGDTSLHAYEPAQRMPLVTHKISSHKISSNRVSSNCRHIPLGDRTELLTHLHILAGLQERDCRVSGLDLADAPEAVGGYATAWLYGAACTLCEPSLRHSEELKEIVAHIASRKTGGRQANALHTIDTMTSNTVLLACFRSGLEGAEFWLEHQHVSPRYSLYGAITNNAFI